MRLDEGLVFLSDTRTNAGVDNVSTYRKLHVFRPADDRIFVLQSAGNLATTQQVLDRIDRDLSDDGVHQSLANVDHLFEAALYVGGLGREVALEHEAALGPGATATFILGGQIHGERPDIFLVYPEGNYIRASDERPFLQIGESKYGKFMLELAVKAHVDLLSATKIAVTSMVSTASSNLSVGPPYDLGVYRTGTFALDEGRLRPDSPALAELTHAWISHLVDGAHSLPPITFEDLHREGPGPTER